MKTFVEVKLNKDKFRVTMDPKKVQAPWVKQFTPKNFPTQPSLVSVAPSTAESFV